MADSNKKIADWLHLEAKAKGRLVLADRELRALEAQREAVVYRSWNLVETEAARQLVMQHAPNEIVMGRAQQLVADATEAVSVCSRMIDLLGGKR